MKTRNVVIAHCLSCGAVAHCESDQELPECCGRPMVKAATESLAAIERRTREVDLDDRADPDRPAGGTPSKPR